MRNHERRHLFHFSIHVAILSLLCVGLGAPCHAAKAVPSAKHKAGTADRPQPPKPLPKAIPASKPPTAPDLFADLTPVNSGEGVVVGEPVVTPASADAKSAAFGAACSRWLQFYVGGQGELGKTPLWSSVELTRIEMGRSDARFSAADVKAVAQGTGATQVVLGTLEVTGAAPQHYALSYRVINAATGQAHGSIPILEGTGEQILAQLPATAQTLCQELGARAPHLPQHIELTAEEWPLLGQGDWMWSRKLSATELDSLAALAPREPLAAFLGFEYTTHHDVRAEWQFDSEKNFADDELKGKVTAILVTQVPGNAIALGELARLDVYQLLGIPEPVQANSLSRPDCYGTCVTNVYWNEHWGVSDKPYEAARHAVRCAPRNPYAWLVLAKVFEAIAFGGNEDKTLAARRLKQWEGAARRATELDPHNVAAWKTLSRAATYNQDLVVADGAFWKAYKLDTTNTNLVLWGLQMYGSEGNFNSKTLEGLIKIASQPQHLALAGFDAAQLLSWVDPGADAKQKAKQLEAKAMQELRDRIARNPDDVLATAILAQRTQRDWKTCSVLYQKVVELRPRSHYAWWIAADRRRWAPGKSGEALDGMRKAVALEPQRPILWRDLAGILSQKGYYEEAEPLLLNYIKHYPNEPRGHYYLGLNYYDQDKVEAALASYQKTLQLSPIWTDRPFDYSLCDLETRTGHLDEAIKIGQRAVQYYPTEVLSHAFLAWALFKKGSLEAAIAECRQGLEIEANNPVVHQCLGDIYLAQGQRIKARIEWQIVVDQGSHFWRGDFYVPQAKAELEKYPAGADTVDTKAAPSVEGLDNEKPQVRITLPTAPATLNQLAEIEGTALDNPGGSGVSHIEVMIQCGKSYWTGTQWVKKRTSLRASRRGDKWHATTQFTPGTLVPGTYKISAVAYDGAGNVSAINTASALSFDGIDDYVSLDALDGLAPGNPVHTIEAWVKVDNSAGTKPWLLLLGGEGDGAHYWLAKDDGKFRLGCWGGGERDFSAALGRWNHIASVFDGTTLRIYVNGVQVESAPAHFNLRGVSLTLGRAYLTHSLLRGAMHHVAVWKSARTPEEIVADMNGGLTGHEPGLLCFWPLNEDKSDVASDLSGNGNAGKLLGAPQWVAPSAVSMIVAPAP